MSELGGSEQPSWNDRDKSSGDLPDDYDDEDVPHLLVDDCDDDGIEDIDDNDLGLEQGAGVDRPPPAAEFLRPGDRSWLAERCEALFSQTAEETFWLGARLTADLLHPGAGELVAWAYRAVHVAAALMAVNSGDGFDLTVDFWEMPVPGLAFAFSIRELPSGGPQSSPHCTLDVSFTEFATIDGVPVDVNRPGAVRRGTKPAESPAGGWNEWIDLFATSDPSELLRNLVADRTLVAEPPMVALARLTTRDWYATALALRVALDRNGRLLEYTLGRDHMWNAPDVA